MIKPKSVFMSSLVNNGGETHFRAFLNYTDLWGKSIRRNFIYKGGEKGFDKRITDQLTTLTHL